MIIANIKRRRMRAFLGKHLIHACLDLIQHTQRDTRSNGASLVQQSVLLLRRYPTEHCYVIQPRMIMRMAALDWMLKKQCTVKRLYC